MYFIQRARSVRAWFVNLINSGVIAGPDCKIRNIRPEQLALFDPCRNACVRTSREDCPFRSVVAPAGLDVLDVIHVLFVFYEWSHLQLAHVRCHTARQSLRHHCHELWPSCCTFPMPSEEGDTTSFLLRNRHQTARRILKPSIGDSFRLHTQYFKDICTISASDYDIVVSIV